jgi:hypothetical protein
MDELRSSFLLKASSCKKEYMHNNPRMIVKTFFKQVFINLL